ncbi:MAG TPA: hypothetical protein ENH10_00160, partial [Bacteroidetes bacterium]|nr:hypothetical protein [Bacteroidota bacterium]HEX03559.1 hypothetical protein [Bacteroidota bacterium]
MKIRLSMNKEIQLQTKSDGNTVTRFTLEEVDLEDKPTLEELFRHYVHSTNVWDPDKNCSKTSYIGMTGLSLDADDGKITIEEAEDLFKNYNYIIYTSTSQLEDKPDNSGIHARFRVILPFEPSDDVYFKDAEEADAVYAWAKSKFEGFDHSVFERSHKFFPKLNPDPDQFILRINTESGWFEVPMDEVEQLKQVESAKPATIHKTLTSLCEENQLTELRALSVRDPGSGTTRNYSGFFDDYEAMAAEAAQINPYAKGVYFTPNPLEMDVDQNSLNQLLPARKGESATDTDVSRIHWLLVDFDPDRQPDTSSTVEEQAASISLAKRVRGQLEDLGWPKPVIASSGNGAHLMYRVDLPIEDSGLIRGALEALAGMFDTPKVHIDKSVHNPSRIWRLYGTWAHKGENTPERPHRQSQILWDESARNPSIITRNQLLAIQPATFEASTPSDGGNGFDIEDWIETHRLKLNTYGITGSHVWQHTGNSSGTRQEGKRWVLQTCPWNAEHTNGAAFIVQRADGPVAAGCHHNGCQGKVWHDLRDIIEPEWRQHRHYPHTDYGNAERLVAQHGSDLRFCNSQKSWYVWDGIRWVEDSTGAVMRKAKATVRAIVKEAEGVQDREKREDILNWMLRSESVQRLKAMKDLAGSEEAVAAKIDKFDPDPWLLNVDNGTIDLRTGKLQFHDRSNMITKLAPVCWNGLAERLPLWERFLNESTDGDKDLQTFLQRAVGYSLTGDTGEDKLFFVHGPGASGKSTFIEAVKNMMGNYCATADFETFLKRSSTGSPRNDIARLVGSRFVASIEVDEGKKLAEGLIKSITGGDQITARFLFREAFEFLPEFKLWLVANDAPDVKAGDDAMWRRILRVPFEQVVPKAKRDPQIKAQLRNPEIAGPAILAWAVQGCLDWQKKGLQIPASVTNATEEYRQEMNPLS